MRNSNRAGSPVLSSKLIKKSQFVREAVSLDLTDEESLRRTLQGGRELLLDVVL